MPQITLDAFVAQQQDKYFFSAIAIQGERYRYPDQVRSGSGGSVVIEPDPERWGSNRNGVQLPQPVAGPIFRVTRRVPIRRTDGAGFDLRFRHVAHCAGCGCVSKEYKNQREPMIFGWAARHRCGRPVE